MSGFGFGAGRAAHRWRPGMGRVLLAPPAGLGWVPPVGVYRTGSGFVTDYDPAAARAAWDAAYPGAAVFRVDVATGNNNNDGLGVSTPVRSIDLAMKLGQDTGMAFKVVVGSGDRAAPRQYKLSATQARSGQPANNGTWRDAWCTTTVTVPCMVVPDVAGGRFDNINLGSSIGFTATADSAIYLATNGLNLVDYAQRSRLGAPRPLVPLALAPADPAAPWPEINAEAARLAAVNDGVGADYALGVYWRDVANARTYVRLFDGRNPAAALNTTLFGADSSLALNMLRPAAAHRYYFEGGNFLAGRQAAIDIRAPTGYRPRIDCVDCTFVGGATAGVFMSSGTSSATDGCDVVMLRCEASGGALDGFNHHGINRTVEIDCEAYWNGRDATGSEAYANNGSTQHEDGRTLSVNGRYLYSQDRSVHDVGTSRRWALGCVAGTRRAAAGGAGGSDGASSAAWASGHPNGSAASMWLDSCAVSDGPWGAAHYPFECHASASLFYANMAPPAANPGAGLVSAFVPSA